MEDGTGGGNGTAGLMLRVKGAKPGRETALDAEGTGKSVTTGSPLGLSTWTTDTMAVLIGETKLWRWVRFRG